jgi:hypothetical protein
MCFFKVLLINTIYFGIFTFKSLSAQYKYAKTPTKTFVSN